MYNPFNKIDKEVISNFIEEKKKLLIIILSAFIFFILILLILISPKKTVVEEKQLTPLSDIVLPEEPSLNEGYKLSRDINEKWTEEEIDKYFMDMSEGLDEQLRKHNSAKIQKLLGENH